MPIATLVLLIVLLIWTLAAVTIFPVAPVLLSAIFDVENPMDDDVCLCFDHIVDCSTRNKTILWADDVCDANPRVLDFSWNALNHSDYVCQVLEYGDVLCGLPLPFLDELEVFLLTGNKLNSFEANGFEYPRLRVLDVSVNNLSQVILESLNTLEVLNLSFNNLTTVPWYELQTSIPNIVQMDLSYNFVTLSGSNEFQFAKKLKHLNLSHNNISEFYEHGTEDLGQLETLDLSGNPILVIYYGLNHLENLKYLNLSQANISVVWSETFYCLQYLKVLDLSFNFLFYIPKGIFKYAVDLEYLDLSNNGIILPEFRDSDDDIDMFMKCNTDKWNPTLRHYLGNLRYLDLSHNSIAGIKTDTFSTMHELRSLKLSSNALSYFMDDAFLSLRQLRELDLSHNQLTSLPRGGFSASENLIRLDVSHNLLMSLGEDGAWGGLAALRRLDASFNFVSALEARALRGLERLEALDLSWNVLRHAPADAFQGLRALRRLNVSFNQLQVVPQEWARHCAVEVSSEGNDAPGPARRCSPKDPLAAYVLLERAMYWPTAFLPPLPWALCLAAAVVCVAVLNYRSRRDPGGDGARRDLEGAAASGQRHWRPSEHKPQKVV